MRIVDPHKTASVLAALDAVGRGPAPPSRTTVPHPGEPDEAPEPGGLSEKEAAERLAEGGANELPRERRRTLPSIALGGREMARRQVGAIRKVRRATMRRRTLLAGAASLALPQALAASAQDDKADEMKLHLQMQALPQIRTAIQTATGHAENAIVLTPGRHQLFVRIVNRKLPAKAGVADDTALVSSAVSRAMAGKEEFSDVDVLHIDYVGDGGDVHTFDFRRDPQGKFQRHVSRRDIAAQRFSAGSASSKRPEPAPPA
jgi:hypothetical protein